MIYNTKTFIQKISINCKELNSVKNIEDILYIKLKILENKCFELGYVKENSIKILNKSSGYLNPIIFVPFIEYKVLCSAEIFKPNINDIYLVEVLSINKIAILCCIKYQYNNKSVIPIRIIIAKHIQDEKLIQNINKNDKLYIKITGYKFTKNSKNIDSIANILTDDELNKIKDLKAIIEKLNNINHTCKIDINKIDIHTNILKFILDKDIIVYNELFIYDFIIKNKINSNTTNYLDLYNLYITNFNKKLNNVNNVNKIIYEEDLTNNETNQDDETYPEDDVEEDLENYDYNYIEELKSENNIDTNLYEEINSESSCSDEEDEEEDIDNLEENSDNIENTITKL